MFIVYFILKSNNINDIRIYYSNFLYYFYSIINFIFKMFYFLLNFLFFIFYSFFIYFFLNISQHFTTYTTYHCTSRYITTYHHISPHISTHYLISPHITTYHHLSMYMTHSYHPPKKLKLYKSTK